MDCCGARNLIDLHMHSTASDGSLGPAELVRMAVRAGIGTLALTDHDSMAGLGEAEAAAGELAAHLVRGVEISTEHKGKRVHMLGLWLPHSAPSLEAILQLRKLQRRQRNEALLANLARLGMPLTMGEVEAYACGSTGRPHIGMAMCARGYVASVAQAFAMYLGDNGRAFIPKEAPTPHEAAGAIAASGGLAIMAHPYFGGFTDEELLKLLPELQEAGLAGLEAWHSRHTLKQTKRLTALARSLGLAISGGSDFHGAAKPSVRMGCSSEGLPVPPELLPPLLHLARRRRAEA